MADHDSAAITLLHQPRPKTAKTPAERARAYRERKRAAALPVGKVRDGADPYLPVSTPGHAAAARGSSDAPGRSTSGRCRPEVVTPPSCPAPPDRRRPGARPGRHDHERLVCAVARIDRDLGLALPGDRRGR